MSEFTWPVRVYYEDTDAGGVVYYANYLKFMERARTEWLRARGFEQDALRERDNVLFMVRSLSVEYLKPARFNELLRIGVVLLDKGKASLQVGQSVSGGAGQALCTATVKLACVHSVTLRPARIPDNLLLEL